MERSKILQSLEEMAALSELAGETPFKAKAYANAARALSMPELDFEDALAPGGLEAIPGVGKGIASLVREAASSGSIAALDELRSKVPPGVVSMLSVQGLGPRKISALWRDLGVTSLGELEYACTENRLSSLKGFGEKTQTKVLEGVRFAMKNAARMLLPSALSEQSELEARAGTAWGLGVAWAGETPRFMEVVGSLHILVAGAAKDELAERLGVEASLGGFKGRTPGGLPLLVTSAEPAAFGAALVWETSSPEFLSELCSRLGRGGIEFRRGGLFSAGARIETPDEGAFWSASGLKPVPPECRELPEALDVDPSELLNPGDIRGAFHCHTSWSDGGNSIEEMVEAAERLGWEYIGICDHSVSAHYANGLSAERLTEQAREIAAVQDRHPGIKIFSGVESDILQDGSLDYPEVVLETLDHVVASVHSRFSLEKEVQTERLKRAVGHRCTTFLGHPTGRLLLAREGYSFDWTEVVGEAAASGAAIELNASPHRLDVDWRRIPGLRGAGVKIGINPDAHSTGGLEDVYWGVMAARKGLAGRGEVINSLGVGAVAGLFRKKKPGRGR